MNLQLTGTASGLYQQALACFRENRIQQAWRLVEKAFRTTDPDLDLYYLAGEICMESGRFDDAVRHYQDAIAIDPAQTDVHFALANAYHALLDFPCAIRQFLKVLSLDPEDHESHNNLANCYQQTGRPVEAEDHYRRAIAMQPERTEYQFNLAGCLVENRAHPAAAGIYRNILKKHPDHPLATFRLAVCLQEIGDFDTARACHLRALKTDPGMAIAAFHLANMAIPGSPESLIRQCERSLPKSASDLQRCYWHFALGRLYQKQGDTDSSFDHFRNGNAIKSGLAPFDPVRHEQYIERIIEFFTPEFFARGIRTDFRTRPIFVVGMPRSGSTLVSQILSAHKQVADVGEHPAMQHRVTELRTAGSKRGIYPDVLGSVDRSRLERMAKKYLAEVGISRRDGEQRVCDKMLGNLLRLGFIAMLFPSACVVHIRRDPMDTCWSAYTQLFERGMRFTYDLEHLGLAYRQYQRLMRHWETVLPLSIVTIDYEQLVRDPETEIRRLLPQCGLDWDSACPDFHRNDAAVRTASFWQVRQPVYRSAVGKWRRYEARLGTLIDALGMDVPAVDQNSHAATAPS